MNKSKSLPWDVVEQAINKEIKWLEDTIVDSPFNKLPRTESPRFSLKVYKKLQKTLPLDTTDHSVEDCNHLSIHPRSKRAGFSASDYKKEVCRKCIFRKIALLILSGKVKAKDIKSSISLWGENRSFFMKPHGKEWHSAMMRLVASYFQSLEYEIEVEPNINFGRADLGAYKSGERNLFIEVGTVSVSKLLINLKSMKGSDILLVLDSNHAVKFSILDTDVSDQFVKTHRKYHPLSKKAG